MDYDVLYYIMSDLFDTEANRYSGSKPRIISMETNVLEEYEDRYDVWVTVEETSEVAQLSKGTVLKIQYAVMPDGNVEYWSDRFVC